MFIRAELKQRAKDSIHRNIWIVIGTFLVFSLLTSSNFGTAVNLETGQHYFRMGLGDYYVIFFVFYFSIFLNFKSPTSLKCTPNVRQKSNI